MRAEGRRTTCNCKWQQAGCNCFVSLGKFIFYTINTILMDSNTVQSMEVDSTEIICLK